MRYAVNKPISWSVVRKQLSVLEKPALIAILKDLYDVSAANKEFLSARFETEENSGEALERSRRKIIDQFFPERGEGKLKLGEARKVIRDYRRATGNIQGTAELLMTYVENGSEYTHRYGDIDEQFYNSIESALDELVIIIRSEDKELYAEFREALLDVVDITSGIGWGFHDYIDDVVAQLEIDFGEEEGVES